MSNVMKELVERTKTAKAKDELYRVWEDADTALRYGRITEDEFERVDGLIEYASERLDNID